LRFKLFELGKPRFLFGLLIALRGAQFNQMPVLRLGVLKA
jgi:hypothetical protein